MGSVTNFVPGNCQEQGVRRPDTHHLRTLRLRRAEGRTQSELGQIPARPLSAAAEGPPPLALPLTLLLGSRRGSLIEERMKGFLTSI